MKSPVDLFNEGCAQWGLGPRLPDRPPHSIFVRVEQIAQGWVAELRKSPIIESLVDIHVDFIDNMTLNAVADIREGLGIIGLCAGAVMLPYDLFHRLLSNPDILPFIGNPGAESAGPQHADGITQNFAELIDKRRQAGRPITAVSPVDPVRLAFAQMAGKVALDFLISHELSHITNGHCGFLLDKVGINYMLELTAHSASAGGDHLTRQTLEMDADTGAVQLTMGIIDTAKTPEKFHPELRASIPNPRAGLYLWGFAMAWLFYLWGLKVNFDELDTEDHPPTGLRFSWCMATALEVVKVHEPDLVPDFNEILTNAFADMVATINSVGGQMSQKEMEVYGAAIQDARSTDLLARVLEHWKVIRPELEDHAYHKKLAP